MSTKRKRVEELVDKTTTENSGSDQDKDFQDFLDSVDDADDTTKDEVVTIVDEEAKHTDYQGLMDSADDEGSSEEQNHQNKAEEASAYVTKRDDRKLEEVQQVAYEARIAKLMLLSRRKKRDKNVDSIDNSAREVGAGLVMNEEEVNEGGKSSELDKNRPLSNPIGSSLKEIMRKNNHKNRLSKQALENDDAYWSNF